MKSLFVLGSAVALAMFGCGGGGTAAVHNATATGTAPLPVGIHQCQFVVAGTAYGPHRCDVTAGTPATLVKPTGMEPFEGTLAPVDGGVRLTAKIGCTDMTVACNQAFAVTLTSDGGTWRGPVEAPSAKPDWFLGTATFEIVDTAGYGGATYGDAWPTPQD